VTILAYAPMLAVPWKAPFDDEDWLFEPKYDGIRAIATCSHASVTLRSRTGNTLTDAYPELQALALLPPDTVLDGEIIAADEAGRPSFELLQGRMHRRSDSSIGLSYVVFDVLASEGTEVVGEPLETRLAIVSSLQLPEVAQASLSIRGSGTALFAATGENDLEGIVAKRYGSPYRPREHSPHWRKIPHVLRTRAVVGGFTDSSGACAFGALLLGLWDGPNLRFVGSVGTGFTQESARAIH
jgi:bifunctional non-homologous end joining protein LigD